MNKKKLYLAALPVLFVLPMLFIQSLPAFGQASFGNLAADSDAKKEKTKDKKSGKSESPEVTEEDSGESADAKKAEVSKWAEPQLGTARNLKFRYGMRFEARPGGECTNVFGTIPVPINWPEQKVRVIEEDIPNGVRVEYRDLREGGCREMVLKMACLKAGQKVEASVTLEIVRSEQAPPTDVAELKIPKRVPKELKQYLRESPFIEINNRKIRKRAKEIAAEIDSDWEKVNAVFREVREKVKYKEAYVEKEVRGALGALESGEGDCEDMSCLMIAYLRNLDIPARTVRVPDHCWAEFYLEDAQGTGHWYPAQVAGNEALGVSSSAQAMQPILQKGDAFSLPESPRETTRYVKEIFAGEVEKNGPNPKYEFIQEEIRR